MHEGVTMAQLSDYLYFFFNMFNTNLFRFYRLGPIPSFYSKTETEFWTDLPFQFIHYCSAGR